METQTEKNPKNGNNKTVAPPGTTVDKIFGEKSFARKKRIGIPLLELVEGQSYFMKVQKFDIFKSEKYPEGIEYFECINLATGEETKFWVDGGMTGALHALGGPQKAVGLNLEIIKGPQKNFEVLNKQTNKMEPAKVNTYSIWELDL